VTHDQVEALTFADQVVVMTQGEVVQTGSAQALFEEPEHTFVGYFIGNPGMNLLDCTLDDGGLRVAGQLLAVSAAARAALSGAQGKITLGVRPEFVECLKAGEGDDHCLEATVTAVRNMGTHYLAEFQLGGATVAAKLRAIDAVAGDAVRLRFPPQRTLFYVNDKRVA
ncbi:MAG: TOBE domain-containing protein, partial [Janthinobacterium sp.]